jgi:hypothetical protein
MPIVCIYMEFRCRLQPHQLRQARLRAAARAQLMRWLKPKTKRSHREAPEVVKTQWNTGNKNDIADMLAKCNFDKDLSQTWWNSWLLTLCMYNSIRPSCSVKFQVYFLCLNACGQDKFVNELTVVVSRKQKVKMLINEGWHTEEEMRTELHWNKLLAFINTELEHMTYIYIYSCQFRWHNTPTSKLSNPTPRARIDGAKSRCQSLGPSHYRPCVFSPQFRMIWCLTLKLLWDSGAAVNEHPYAVRYI